MDVGLFGQEAPLLVAGGGEESGVMVLVLMKPGIGEGGVGVGDGFDDVLMEEEGFRRGVVISLAFTTVDEDVDGVTPEEA